MYYNSFFVFCQHLCHKLFNLSYYSEVSIYCSKFPFFIFILCFRLLCDTIGRKEPIGRVVCSILTKNAVCIIVRQFIRRINFFCIREMKSFAF